MKINRDNIISLIILDIIVIILALGLFGFRYYNITNLKIETTKETEKNRLENKKDTLNDINILSQNYENEYNIKDNQAKETRNILFQFIHSKANKVEIIGDFNNWVPQSLNKVGGNKWNIAIKIPPGEYGYNFIMDGKIIPDPVNPKTCDRGRGFISSYLKVKSLLEEN